MRVLVRVQQRARSGQKRRGRVEVGRSEGAHGRGRGGAPSGLWGAAKRARRSEGGRAEHARQRGERSEEGERKEKKRRKEKGKRKMEKGKGKRRGEKKRERERFAPALIAASTAAGRPRARVVGKKKMGHRAFRRILSSTMKNNFENNLARDLFCGFLGCYRNIV